MTQHVAHRASDEVAQQHSESQDGSIRKDPMVSLWDEIERLRAENERLRHALKASGYALFQIKRMVPEAIPEFAAEESRKASDVLDGTP